MTTAGHGMTPAAAMALPELLAGLTPGPVPPLAVTALASDSRRVVPGALFCAVKGLEHHGMAFVAEARRAGAVAVAFEPPWSTPLPEGLPAFPVAQLGRRLCAIAERFYHFPSRALSLVGVTGTDGKTSCTHFLAQALSYPGSFEAPPAGVLGTLGYGTLGHLEPASHTTPDALTTVEHLARLRRGGARAVAMEVSSHALDQGRVDGLTFAGAVLTHVSRDHLDYHGTLANYAAAKGRLFLDLAPGFVVLNGDDTWGSQWAKRAAARVIRYGLQCPPEPGSGGGETLVASRVAATPQGLHLDVVAPWGTGTLQLPLWGRFNAYNVLAVLGALGALGAPWPEALERVAALKPVPGRMEHWGGGQAAPVAVVDYAHTPHALGQALEALRHHRPRRLWCVFGAGGERDRGKRPRMGATAERFADGLVITNDNPRGEDPAAIAAEIRAGLQRPEAAAVILDRRRAIHYALERARPGDIVLVAGKGHETEQQQGLQRLPFSDRAVVSAWLGGRC